MEKYLINKPGVHEIKLRLAGEGDRLEWLGIIDARKKGDYELNLVITHLVPETFGRVVIKGVAENGARVKIKGTVIIKKQAQLTDSMLIMKFLLLDKKSLAIVEPELEIEANRVKASHSASVGKIDEEQLFYLKSRGIGENKGKKMIINSFMN